MKFGGIVEVSVQKNAKISDEFNFLLCWKVIALERFYSNTVMTGFSELRPSELNNKLRYNLNQKVTAFFY